MGAATAPSPGRDRIGRLLMAIAAVGAVGPFAPGVGNMQGAAPDRLWVEAWRTFGFLVFAGMFALLALFPRSARGLWELSFAHKAGMVVFSLFAGDVAEARFAGRVDILLVAMIAAAWWLCQGWKSWSRSG